MALRPAPVIEAWLRAARACGEHRGTLELPPHHDQLVLGAWRVEDGLRLSCPTRWVRRYGQQRQEWDSELAFQADWDAIPEGLRLSNLRVEDDTATTLIAWGAQSAQTDLAEVVTAALTHELGRPLPWGEFVRRGAWLVAGPGDPPGEGEAWADLAWLRAHLPAGVELAVRGSSWTLTVNGQRTRWSEAAVPPIRVVLPLMARSVDALHDEVHGLRLDLCASARAGAGVGLTLVATPWRERRPVEVTLEDVALDAAGEPARLMFRTAAGVRVEMPISHARSARARGTLGVAAWVAGGGGVREQLVAWGLVRP